MPNIKSAKKRVKVTKVKHLNNQMAKSELKTSIKKFESSLSEGDAATREAAYKACVKNIDRAAAKGLIHKNNASRKKSAMTLKLNAAQQ